MRLRYFAFLAAACSGTSGAPLKRDMAAPADTRSSPSENRDAAFPDSGGAPLGRPYHVRVPLHYDAAQPTPLLVMLHGLTASGDVEENFVLHLSSLADEKTFLYATPDGSRGPIGGFWNATDACCDFWAIPVDDVAYISAVIDDIGAHYNLDRHRVYVIGHSNGGFMTHRLACDLSGKISAVVSLAGANWKDPNQCMPSSAVSVLELHGDKDPLVDYNGGNIVGFTAPPFPSAHDTVATWALRNGCTGPLAPTGARYDIDNGLAGTETRVEAYSGCRRPVELWTIEGGGHVPGFTPEFRERIWDFLNAHAK